MGTWFEFGMQEFAGVIDDLEDARRSVPDLLEDELKREQLDFKKEMKKETWRAVEKKTGNLVKGYKFGKVERIGTSFQTDFYAEGKKNAHFHLINNGHDIVRGGKVIGFAPGYRIKEAVTEKWDQEHIMRLRRIRDNIVNKVK